MEDLGKCNLFFDPQINEILSGTPTDFSQDYLIGMVKYLRDEVEVFYRGFESFRLFHLKLKAVLFGDDYAERVSPDQLTDEKLLEAVRMLKEVY